MTSEQPQVLPAAERPTNWRRLRRRETDRVIAGVAGGVADYLNVDPLLLRAGFAGLVIFGGAGLVLYVVAWLLIPADGHAASLAEELFTRLQLRVGHLGMAAIVVVGGVGLGAWLNGYGPGQRFREAALFAVAIIALGIVLLRIGERSRGDRPPAQAGPTEGPGQRAGAIGMDALIVPSERAAQGAGITAIGLSPRERVRSQPRERSPLAWYIVAASLLAVGLLAVVDNVPDLRVTLGQYLGTILAAVGLGLVMGAWWGRARLLILLGLPLLPVALASALITMPLQGGIGAVEFRPQTHGELRPAYLLAAGDMRLDLTGVALSDQPISLSARVGVGRLVVVVPSNARLQLEVTVNGGGLSIFGNRQIGTWLTDRVERPTGAGPLLILRLETDLGSVSVRAAPTP